MREPTVHGSYMGRRCRTRRRCRAAAPLAWPWPYRCRSHPAAARPGMSFSVRKRANVSVRRGPGEGLRGELREALVEAG